LCCFFKNKNNNLDDDTWRHLEVPSEFEKPYKLLEYKSKMLENDKAIYFEHTNDVE